MGIKNTIKQKIKLAKETKKETNKRFKNYFFLDEQYRKKQELAFEKLLSSAYETKNEKKLWKKYEKATLESFENGVNPHRKFRLNTIFDLGLDFDILFVYTKKDVGKTTQMAKMLQNIRIKDPDAQICFIRNSQMELEGFKNAMNNSPIWPTWTDGEHVWWKSEIKGRKIRANVKPCGFMAYPSGLGFVKWQGGDWRNLKFWMWDECNSVEGGLKFEVFQKLVVFLSSLIRDKKQVMGFMFGNLLEKSNIFLSRLGVGSHTRLKIFDAHEDNDPRKPLLSRMLYLNTGDLFKGIEEQKGLATQLLESQEHEKLLHNRPGATNIKAQFEELDLKNYTALFCFVFVRKKQVDIGIESIEYFILYAYKIPLSMRLVIWIDRYSNDTVIKPGFRSVCCYDEVISNIFDKTILLEEEDFAEYIEILREYMAVGELWFGWNDTQSIYQEMWYEWKTKFIKEDEDEK